MPGMSSGILCHQVTEFINNLTFLKVEISTFPPTKKIGYNDIYLMKLP